MIIPKYTDFRSWANKLNVDYPSDTIPVAPHEDNWKDWAKSVVQSRSFTTANVPSPTSEKSWQEWSRKFYRAMGSHS
jgi:hypothetical protein